MAASTVSVDVFIVGGGPAGLAAAIAARRKGFNVMVADGSEPPIDKSCGEGLMPDTVSALHALGVKFDRDAGRDFCGISLIQKNARVSATFSKGKGIGMRRPVLHERLLATAEECGVRLLWNTPVTGVTPAAPLTFGTVHLAGSTTISARWIVAADGQGSRVRKWTGLDGVSHVQQRFASRRHYRAKPWSRYMEIYWAGDAQAYVTPTGREEVCVVVMTEPADHRSFEDALADMPELGERLCGAPLTSRQRGAVSAMRSLRRVQKQNVALLGDASGGVDAITGEGLRLAFRQAVALADAIAANDLAQYQKAHRQLAVQPLFMSRVMLWLGRNPRIRSRAIQVLQEHPDLFAKILAAHSGKETPAHLVATGAQLGFRLLAHLN